MASLLLQTLIQNYNKYPKKTWTEIWAPEQGTLEKVCFLILWGFGNNAKFFFIPSQDSSTINTKHGGF